MEKRGLGLTGPDSGDLAATRIDVYARQPRYLDNMSLSSSLLEETGIDCEQY